jgi:hypothetical protein
VRDALAAQGAAKGRHEWFVTQEFRKAHVNAGPFRSVPQNWPF